MGKLYNSFGARTTLGWALSFCALSAGILAALLIIPATLWALFSAVIVDPAMRTSSYSWKLAMLFACPIMLIVATAVGFKSFFGHISGWSLSFAFLPMLLAVAILAVDLRWVRIYSLTL